MRVIYFLICGLLLLGGAHATTMGSLAYLDESFGFHGVRFGDPPPSDFIAVPIPDDLWGALDEEGKRTMAHYRRKNENLVLENGQIASVTYVYKNKKLQSILIEADGARNVQALLRMLYEAYGQPTERIGRAAEGSHAWVGKRVAAMCFVQPGEARATTLLSTTANAQ